MPSLTVIAGCNGAGKSTFAPSFLNEGDTSFDYDRLFLEFYNSLPDSELRTEMASNMTSKAFETAVERAWAHELDFCYETNFDEHPTYWPNLFREKGYKLNLIFFCLDNIEIAKHRVLVRTEFNGHFVDEETIERKWRLGYKNVNLHFSFFDNLLIVDNSYQNEVYTNILQIDGNELDVMSDSLPSYFERRFPTIYQMVISK